MVRKKKEHGTREQLLEKCLMALVRSGTLDLSLDVLAHQAGSSKRMLVHHFGSRDALEEEAVARLEDMLRARFRASAFPAGTTLRSVIQALWRETTSLQSRGALLVTMDLLRRGWSGSERGRRFFEEQQRLWAEMLREFLPDPQAVELLLQQFQGAVLVYLVTGDRERGLRTLDRLIAMESGSRKKRRRSA